ncbi:MAG: hypothetical protein HY958_06075 [Bacteroidia bacterium]|nr:hypothetical protein [Bacteroidia bacterium]
MNEEHTTNFDKQVVIELIKNFNLTYSKKKKYKITKTNNPINIPKFESIIVLETIYEKSSSLVLETYVYDIQDIEIISLDLLNYINSNQYVKSYFEIERSKYEAIRKRIEERIKEMETMKNLLVTSKSMVFFNILKDISSMEERNADILNIINKLNGFEIAVDPTVPLKPEGIGLTYFVLFGFAGLFTGILLSLFIEKVLFLN